jgi:hypothetical protein
MASIDAAASGADAAFSATGLQAGAWFNLDLIWSAAPVATGTLTLTQAGPY